MSIQNRLANLSATEAIFNDAVPYYDDALKRSGLQSPVQIHTKAKQPPTNKQKNNYYMVQPTVQQQCCNGHR